MEDLDQIAELTPEQDAEANAAFEAAFNEASGNPAANVETANHAADGSTNAGTGNTELTADELAAQEAQAAAEAEAAAAAAAEAEANAPVAVTRAELDALRAAAGQITALQEELRRTTDTVNGKFGSLKQTIDAVKAQAAQGVKPTFGQMKRLEEEYPEFAAALRGDLEDAFGPGNAIQAPAPAATEQQGDGKASGDAPGANPAPQAPADPLADPRVQQVLMQKEMRIVDAKHPDWRDLAQTPEFNEWKSSLPAEQQQMLVTSWESDILNDAFSEFKGWKAKRSAAADANKQRDKRLVNGVPATTGRPTGANADNPDDAFLSGFTSARKR